jgi:hypothetical protein
MDDEITYFDPLADKSRREKDIAKLRVWAPKVQPENMIKIKYNSNAW